MGSQDKLNGRIEALKRLILKYYEPIDAVNAGIVEGSQLIGEDWFAPKKGPDTLAEILRDKELKKLFRQL